jgi:hypothetical protein
MTPSGSSGGASKIFWDSNVGAYRMVTPYNAVFVDLLKTTIPASDRLWDPAAKMWTITERCLPGVRELVTKLFRQPPTVITKEQAQTASQPKSVMSSPLDSVIVEFFRLLPFEAAQRAYRHAATVLHPDHGGDMTSMSKLNAAWQRLEKDLYTRGAGNASI